MILDFYEGIATSESGESFGWPRRNYGLSVAYVVARTAYDAEQIAKARFNARLGQYTEAVASEPAIEHPTMFAGAQWFTVAVATDPHAPSAVLAVCPAPNGSHAGLLAARRAIDSSPAVAVRRLCSSEPAPVRVVDLRLAESFFFVDSGCMVDDTHSATYHSPRPVHQDLSVHWPNRMIHRLGCTRPLGEREAPRLARGAWQFSVDKTRAELVGMAVVLGMTVCLTCEPLGKAGAPMSQERFRRRPPNMAKVAAQYARRSDLRTA